MQRDQSFSATACPNTRMPVLVETLLSALAGCGIVLMLAFFLSLEAWVVAAAG